MHGGVCVPSRSSPTWDRGFNIAMQDLDIRGAGNLLGAEQSGFIADIGFETYQKIMREAVAELRAEGLDVAGLSDREQEVVEQLRYVEDAAVEVDVEAELPDSYVSQTAEKLRLYRELDAMRSEEELQRFRAAARRSFRGAAAGGQGAARRGASALGGGASGHGARGRSRTG